MSTKSDAQSELKCRMCLGMSPGLVSHIENDHGRSVRHDAERRDRGWPIPDISNVRFRAPPRGCRSDGYWHCLKSAR